MKIKNIFYLLFFITCFFSQNSLAQVIRSTTFDNRELCEKEGGVWRQFGNGCVDSCRAKLDRFVMCTMALTYGCDCGQNRCFDNNKCIKISNYAETFEKEQKFEQEEQEKQKEARKDQYRNARNLVLSDLNETKNVKDNKQKDSFFKTTTNQDKKEPNNNLAQFKNNTNQTSSPVINVLKKPVLEKNEQNSDSSSVTPVQQKFQIPSIFLKNNNDNIKKDDSNSVKSDKEESVKSKNDSSNSTEGLPKVSLPQ